MRLMKLFQPAKETWLYRINPAGKFLIFMSLLLIALINNQFDFAFYQMVFYMVLLLAYSGYSGKKLLLFTSPFILTFLSSASTMILFGKGSEIWWSWGLIKISNESFHHGLLIGFKTLSFGALGMLFALTTKPLLLFYALMQQFRLPAKYAYSFIAAIRMLPLLWEEIGARRNALEIRGIQFSPGVRGWYERLQQYAVPLLAQSIRRAQRVAIAMEAKRFQMGSARTYYYQTRFAVMDLICLLFFIGVLAGAYAVSVILPIKS